MFESFGKRQNSQNPVLGYIARSCSSPDAIAANLLISACASGVSGAMVLPFKVAAALPKPSPIACSTALVCTSSTLWLLLHRPENGLGKDGV